jgi:DNA-binding MarR family transcriptional regulator
MPVSRETVTELFRQIQALGRSTKTVAGREPFAGLRLGTAMMLGQVESAGEVRCSGLAESLGLDISVVSRQLGILEELGLTARRPDPADGRAWLCHITPAGTELLARLRDQRLRAIESALAGWVEDEARSLINQLARLESDLRRSAGSGSRTTPTYSSASPKERSFS